MNFEFSIIINRPVEEVYNFFWNLDERDFSDNPVVPIYARLDKGSRRIGSQIREVVRIPFFQMEIISEIIGFIPNKWLEYKFKGGGMEGQLLYQFKSVRNETELNQKVSLCFRGIRKILTPLLPLTYRKKAKKRLWDIKAVIEKEEEK
ncbi:MAG: hypothetical protein L6N94_02015 [Candidatus Methylarchaceae archaeon HK01M]|nr:hypothetical protein [Candidatus Methylarchaceae archaeon HK01M]